MPAVLTPKRLGLSGVLSRKKAEKAQDRGSLTRAWFAGSTGGELAVPKRMLMVDDQRARNAADAARRWNRDVIAADADDSFTGEVYTVGRSTIAVFVSEQSFGTVHASAIIVGVRTGLRITSMLYLDFSSKLAVSVDKAVELTRAQNAAPAKLNRPLPGAVTEVQEAACGFGRDVHLEAVLSQRNYSGLTIAAKQRLVRQFQADDRQYVASFGKDKTRPGMIVLEVRSKKTGRIACVQALAASTDEPRGTRCP